MTVSSISCRVSGACPRWFVSVLMFGLCSQVVAQSQRVTVESSGWEMVGDLIVPDSPEAVPAVLMLNQAAGDRRPYASLAAELSSRGMASLRLDLMGHGESTNLGTFVPGERDMDPIIWEADKHIPTILEYLRSVDGVDPDRIAIVGASYSGEEATESGRNVGYADAYVMLSPGSFSDQSIAAIDSSNVRWLFVASREDRFLQEITESVQARSTNVELLVLPGGKHATDLLDERPDLAERIAIWIAASI
jgi:dienelactone hydrolase